MTRETSFVTQCQRVYLFYILNEPAIDVFINMYFSNKKQMYNIRFHLNREKKDQKNCVCIDLLRFVPSFVVWTLCNTQYWVPFALSGIFFLATVILHWIYFIIQIPANLQISNVRSWFVCVQQTSSMPFWFCARF